MDQILKKRAVDGKGQIGQVAVWDGGSRLAGSEDLVFDDVAGKLTVKGKPLVADVPKDGTLYARRNRKWEAFSPGGGGGASSSGEGDGTQGPPGPAGPQGPAGTPGEIGPEGPQGDPGPAGTDGTDGAPGPAGADGAPGPTGPAGADGDDGATGPQGIQGIPGNNGATGPKGDTGATGPTGPTGATGATGPAGVTFPDAPVDTKQYARRDGGWVEVVAFTSSAVHEYMLNATTSAPPSSGTVRANNATPSAVTTIWINYTNYEGVDIKTYFAQRVKVGDTFYFQDRDDASKWQLYELNAAYTDSGTYATMPVTWRAGGTAIGAARIIVSREGASVSSPIGEAPTDGQRYARASGNWTAIPKMTVASSAPSSPAVNDVWVDTT
jgi:hypothetical protein